MLHPDWQLSEIQFRGRKSGRNILSLESCMRCFVGPNVAGRDGASRHQVSHLCVQSCKESADTHRIRHFTAELCLQGGRWENSLQVRGARQGRSVLKHLRGACRHAPRGQGPPACARWHNQEPSLLTRYLMEVRLVPVVTRLVRSCCEQISLLWRLVRASTHGFSPLTNTWSLNRRRRSSRLRGRCCCRRHTTTSMSSSYDDRICARVHMDHGAYAADNDGACAEDSA